jgi:2,3-bisphosphoglycerate-independent phosphoglycerate mutase
MNNHRIFLMILDGWGHGKVKASSAIEQANVPFMRSLYQKYPNSELVTFGKEVGLPEGQMGNSEVGHLNIGAGRIVYQELQRINHEIETKTFFKNSVLQDMMATCVQKRKPLHLMGLISDGGIHSHIEHAKALVTMAEEQGVPEVYIHAFLDGRDTDPKSGYGFIEELLTFCQDKNAQVVSLCGRYYAMDRDKRWERVQLAYDMLVHGKAEKVNDLTQAIKDSYQAEVTDEFVKPIIVDGAFKPIREGDVVMCFNFRTDRCREITEVLTQADHEACGMKKLTLHYYTMTNYNEKFKNIGVVFEKDNLHNTLGEVLSKHNKKQIRIAETEKYPHVTFFFSGGREQPFHHEERILVASPKVATYDLKPEMSAFELKDKIMEELKHPTADFICLNFANADMVGHTGSMEAAIKAVEAVDQCVAQIVTKGSEVGYSFIIIADHGNADYMINEDGTPNTAHTMNPVPVIILNERVKAVKPGKLADIAPTVLHLMGIPQPAEMNGVSLV